MINTAFGRLAATCLALTLVSCSDMAAPNTEMTMSDAPEQPTANTAASIGGKIEQWRGGHVRAEVMVRSAQNRPQLLASGMVTPYGNVTINLPPRVPRELLYALQPSGECQSRLALSKGNVSALNVQDFLLRHEDQVLGLVENRGELGEGVKQGNTYISRFYVTDDVEVIGTLQCGPLKESYGKMSLKQGWNTLKTTIEEVSDSGQVLAVRYTQPADQPLEFRVYAPAQAGVMVYAPAQVSMKPNTARELPITLLPANRYAGPVQVRLEGVAGVRVVSGAIEIPAPSDLPNRLTPFQSVVRLQTVTPTASAQQAFTGQAGQATGGKDAASAKQPELAWRDGVYAGTLVFVTGDTEQRVPLSVDLQGNPVLSGGETFTLPMKAGTQRPVNVNLSQFDFPHPQVALPISLLGAPAGITLSEVSLPVAANEATGTVLAQLSVAAGVPAGQYVVQLGSSYQGLALRSRPLTVTVLPSRLAVSIERTQAPARAVADTFALAYQVRLESLDGFQGKVRLSFAPIDAAALLETDKDQEVSLQFDENKTLPITISIPQKAPFLSSFMMQVQALSPTGEPIEGLSEWQVVPVLHLK